MPFGGTGGIPGTKGPHSVKQFDVVRHQGAVSVASATMSAAAGSASSSDVVRIRNAVAIAAAGTSASIAAVRVRNVAAVATVGQVASAAAVRIRNAASVANTSALSSANIARIRSVAALASTGASSKSDLVRVRNAVATAAAGQSAQVLYLRIRNASAAASSQASAWADYVRDRNVSAVGSVGASSAADAISGVLFHLVGGAGSLSLRSFANAANVGEADVVAPSPGGGGGGAGWVGVSYGYPKKQEPKQRPKPETQPNVIETSGRGSFGGWARCNPVCVKHAALIIVIDKVVAIVPAAAPLLATPPDRRVRVPSVVAERTIAPSAVVPLAAPIIPVLVRTADASGSGIASTSSWCSPVAIQHQDTSSSVTPVLTAPVSAPEPPPIVAKVLVAQKRPKRRQSVHAKLMKLSEVGLAIEIAKGIEWRGTSSGRFGRTRRKFKH